MSSGLSQPSLHAVLIDSIGNARAPQSQSLLLEHVTGSHDNLAAKHAAVKALQGYDTEQVHHDNIFPYYRKKFTIFYTGFPIIPAMRFI